MAVSPDPKADIVAMLKRVGLAVIDPNLDGWRVLAETTWFSVVCGDHRASVHNDPKCIDFFFIAKSLPAGSWKMTVAEAQQFAGVQVTPLPISDVPTAEVILKDLCAPLNKMLQQYDGRPNELLAACRKLRFP